MRQAVWHGAVLITARLGASALVRMRGFEALSDDDFARITIAQAFAAQPKLDPTGTSWLPAPFWVQGGAMMLLGRSISTAYLVSAVTGCASMLILYGAARLAGVRATSALLASLACTLLPAAALAGAASVPELSVAALTAAACLLLRAPDPRWLLAAGAMMLVASLSRYEPWTVCAVVAAVAAVGAPVAPDGRRAPRPPHERGWRVAAAGLSLAGPGLWLAWNAYAHGDALHFHARVASYRDALGVAGGLGTLLQGYPRAIAREGVPWLVLLAVILILLRSRPELRNLGALRAWAAPLGAAGAMLGALILAEVAGGAPTHHPERALLAVWFVAWFAAADWLDRSLSRRKVAVVAALACTILILDVVRLSRILPWSGIDRRTDVQAGEWLKAHAAPDERVLIEPVDYGYFAVMAGAGGPESFIVVRTMDPREASTPSPFETAAALRSRVQREQATWVMARNRASVREAFGVSAKIGEWEIANTESAR